MATEEKKPQRVKQCLACLKNNPPESKKCLQCGAVFHPSGKESLADKIKRLFGINKTK